MNEIAVHQPTHDLAVLDNEQLRYISGSEFVPPGLRGNLPAVLACVATGRALGIPDMTALRSIHIIDGKATFSAELMVQLVRRRGHSITGQVTDGAATVTGKRADNGDEMTVTWTTAMAERAGLLNKQNWRKYPEAMLWARAASQLCRMLFADCFAGQTYTPEEIGVEHTDSVGEPQAGPPVSQADSDVDCDDVEPASPTEADPIDMSDPDIPFGDAPNPAAAPPPITEPQKTKLNVLLKATLKDVVSTDRVYTTVAAMRHWAKDELINHVGGRDTDGELHWSPLRDSLSKLEATELIDKLERFEASR